MSSLDLLHTLRRPALTVGGIVLASCGLTACGDDETKVDLGDGKSATVKEDGDEVTVKTDEGEVTTGKDVKPPAGFPSDLPMLKAEHTITSSVSNGDQKMIMVASDEGLDVEAEYEHVQAEAVTSGWSVDEHTLMDQGDTGQAIIELTKDGVKASYMITVAKGEPAAGIISVAPIN